MLFATVAQVVTLAKLSTTMLDVESVVLETRQGNLVVTLWQDGKANMFMIDPRGRAVRTYGNSN